jgi:hypothetical protein
MDKTANLNFVATFFVGYKLKRLPVLLSSKSTQDPLLKQVLDPQPKKDDSELLDADTYFKRRPDIP